MGVNFTFEACLAALFAVTYFYGFAVSVNQIRRGYNYGFFQYAAVGWITNAFAGVFYTLSCLLVTVDLAVSINLCKTFVIFQLISAVFVSMKADSLKREQADPVKLAVILILATIVIVSFLTVPGVVYPQTVMGIQDVTIIPLVALPWILAWAVSMGYYSYCTYLVSKRAPAALKRISRIFAGGVIVITLSIMSVPVVEQLFPGGYLIPICVGALMDVYAYSHQPKLVFVLPFTALRLTALDTDSCLPLYTHTWNRQGGEDLADENLFSGMLQGVSMIVKESLKRGSLQEIHVEGAIIIAYRIPEYPIAYVLVATRPTRSLRDSLRHFADQFTARFKDGFTTPNNIDQFRGADEIVAACFPHVPVYE
jgi:hypothetical protein